MTYRYIETGNAALEIAAANSQEAIAEAQKMVQASYDADPANGEWEAVVEDEDGERIATVRSATN